jgi:hypothetical protein
MCLISLGKFKPQLFYIPGNHDRLCNRYPSLRGKVIKTLGLKNSDPDIPFEHSFLSEEYGVFARHGHGWDPFNFETSEDFRYQKDADITYFDYMNTPYRRCSGFRNCVEASFHCTELSVRSS